LRKLSKLSEKANLGKPDEVLAVINQRETSNGTKNVTINAYAKYLKIIGIEWEKPKFKRVEHLPFIPTEEELNALIAGASKTIATFCQLLKETGIRSIEATYLKHSDIDTENSKHNTRQRQQPKNTKNKP
jgi:integrase